MKFKILGAICSFFFILSISSPVFAHGGSLDSNGCHHDRSNGSYHCHNGDNTSGSKYKTHSKYPQEPESSFLEELWSFFSEIIAGIFVVILTLFSPVIIFAPLVIIAIILEKLNLL